ncbi:hypothetical protein ACFVU4_21190 [Streptomyces sp. NPDC058107]|uniref:hypothetical protein n=1 Tax=Streptomyces sp. NPDC058107 TaxID=3346343 RepID=UPI0036E349BA
MAAELMLDVASFEFDKHMTNYEETMDYTSWNEHEDVILETDPHLVAHFEKELVYQIRSAFKAVGKARNREIRDVWVREVVPDVGPGWREELAQQLKGGAQSNQARKDRLAPRHPVIDNLHLTNEWEHRVYTVLREQQCALPDIETIGILPLPGMRVRGHTFEPDLLVTYKGRAGVIEIDGPHHKGRRSDDASRERLLRNAGIRHIDRIDVRDSTTKAEVEKFVETFLKHLTA